eukprot:5735196-Amphidinium_carterae.2
MLKFPSQPNLVGLTEYDGAAIGQDQTPTCMKCNMLLAEKLLGEYNQGLTEESLEGLGLGCQMVLPGRKATG